MVISELISNIKSELTDNAAFEAREVVAAALEMDKNELIIKAKESSDDISAKRAYEMLKRRKNGEPLQYILGVAEFMSLEFEVNRYTLIPRSDTETLVEEIIKRVGDESVSILDIGTGTGCIGISLGKYLANAKITLADISEGALQTARRNAEKNDVPVEILHLDILKEIPKGRYDIVVSNPPYIQSKVIPNLQTEVKDYEPMTALDGGEDGLIFYRRIVDIAPDFLNDNGTLAFEIGYDQGEDLMELMSNGFEDIEIIKDLCGNDRVVIGSKK